MQPTAFWPQQAAGRSVTNRSVASATRFSIGRSTLFLFRRKLSTAVICGLFLRKFAQAFLFLLSFLFQISLALFKRVIWFCQNNIPDRPGDRMKRYNKKQKIARYRRHSPVVPDPVLAKSVSNDFHRHPIHPLPLTHHGQSHRGHDHHRRRHHRGRGVRHQSHRRHCAAPAGELH